MNKQEAAKLLSLIQLAYPHTYRDMNQEWKRATVHMWAMSFPGVPYPVMEMAFQRWRMEQKYPPTVAEMAGELAKLHTGAEEAALVQAQLGNRQLCAHYRQVMEWTRPQGAAELPEPAERREEIGQIPMD